MTVSISLPNGYYLHQIHFSEKMDLFPGNKINHAYIYDVVYDSHQEVLTSVFYISKEATSFKSNELIFEKKNNIIDKIIQDPDVIVCTEKSLAALFFYYKRFYQRATQKPIIIVQTEQLLPFHAIPSKIILPQVPNHVIAAVPYFEDLNIPSRIASTTLDRPGWYEGHILELLKSPFKKILSI